MPIYMYPIVAKKTKDIRDTGANLVTYFSLVLLQGELSNPALGLKNTAQKEMVKRSVDLAEMLRDELRERGHLEHE